MTTSLRTSNPNEQPPAAQGAPSAASLSAAPTPPLPLEEAVPGSITWREAQSQLAELSNGWLYLEPVALCAHELDCEGNSVEPRLHGLFNRPTDAVAYARDLLKARSR